VRLAVLSVALTTVLALAGCAAEEDANAPADRPADQEAEQNANGRVGSHGMVLFGDRTRAYVSHIPVFGPPHDVQAIAEISLPSSLPSAVPQTFSDRLYTFLPDRMSLDAFRLGTLRTMRGTIFLGNFEQGGRPVASGVTVNIGKIVHQHELRANEALPSAPTYFLFGTPDKAFAVHKIAGAPGFDQISAVELGTRRPSDVDLAKGIVVTLPSTTDKVESRLAGPREVKSQTASFDIKRALELSCLLGDGFTDACE